MPAAAARTAPAAAPGGRSSLQLPPELTQPVALGRQHDVVHALAPQLARHRSAPLGLDLGEALADRPTPRVDLEPLTRLRVDQRKPADGGQDALARVAYL